MLWIILLLFLLLTAWILLSPVEFKIDTRIPVIIVQWKNVGNAMLSFENEVWWLKLRILFFSKEWDLMQIISAEKKKKKVVKRPRKKSGRKSISFLKVSRILKTFEVLQWKIAINANDNTQNASWYWLNFLPVTRHHIHVNFMDENYLVLVIRNKAWRMVYAFIK